MADYEKMAREILYEETIETQLHARLVASIAHALEKVALEARINERIACGLRQDDMIVQQLRTHLAQLNGGKDAAQPPPAAG